MRVPNVRARCAPRRNICILDTTLLYVIHRQTGFSKFQVMRPYFLACFVVRMTRGSALGLHVLADTNAGLRWDQPLCAGV